MQITSPYLNYNTLMDGARYFLVYKSFLFDKFVVNFLTTRFLNGRANHKEIIAALYSHC